MSSDQLEPAAVVPVDTNNQGHWLAIGNAVSQSCGGYYNFKQRLVYKNNKPLYRLRVEGFTRWACDKHRESKTCIQVLAYQKDLPAAKWGSQKLPTVLKSIRELGPDLVTMVASIGGPRPTIDEIRAIVLRTPGVALVKVDNDDRRTFLVSFGQDLDHPLLQLIVALHNGVPCIYDAAGSGEYKVITSADGFETVLTEIGKLFL